tara:strand:- start:735 stop:1517 length:783 start_codon:yes stop_codon:yes gene_type:complete
MVKKKGKGKKKEKSRYVSASGKPKVSVCTPTYNRRKFIPNLIRAYQAQDYPPELLEWIIVDDGEDCVEDLFKDVPTVKYFRVEEKMKLGRKRNFMHTKCTGEIIVYMDDDDYYPYNRVSHAVNKLRSRHHVLAAGSSAIFLYFQNLNKIYKFGPYGPNHSTGGTFAFKRRLLGQTRYNDEAELAEEKEFLKNYTIPFIQLDPMKTILVFAHDKNTFDKNNLLKNPNPKVVKETNMKLKTFFGKDKKLLEFYKNFEWEGKV